MHWVRFCFLNGKVQSQIGDVLTLLSLRNSILSWEADLQGISWAIGGESGPNHRPVEAEWVREIRKQCKQQGVAFFFKQWGGRTPKSGGRTLDGREWNEYPEGFGYSLDLPLAAIQ